MIDGPVKAYPEHDCRAWNTIHWHSRPEYIAAVCGICGNVVGFRWHSIYKRVYSLFSHEVS